MHILYCYLPLIDYALRQERDESSSEIFPLLILNDSMFLPG